MQKSVNVALEVHNKLWRNTDLVKTALSRAEKERTQLLVLGSFPKFCIKAIGQTWVKKSL